MIVTLGPKGTNSHDLAKTLFPEEEIEMKETFLEVFEYAYQNGISALVPVENSTIGPIVEVVNLLEKYKFVVAETIDCPIRHSLLSNHNVSDLSEIKKVYSQTYAINQCQNFISEKLKNAEVILTQSTSAAAKIIKENNLMDEASIGSLSAAKECGLVVVLEGIQDDDNNVTKFALVSKS